jgi:hypothetical protein
MRAPLYSPRRQRRADDQTGPCIEALRPTPLGTSDTSAGAGDRSRLSTALVWTIGSARKHPPRRATSSDWVATQAINATSPGAAVTSSSLSRSDTQGWESSRSRPGSSVACHRLLVPAGRDCEHGRPIDHSAAHVRPLRRSVASGRGRTCRRGRRAATLTLDLAVWRMPVAADLFVEGGRAVSQWRHLDRSARTGSRR